MPHRSDTERAAVPGRRRRPRRGLAVLLAPLAVLALVAGACGGDDGDDTANGGGGGGGEGSGIVNAENCPVAALDDASGTVDITVWHSYAGLTKTTIEELAARYNGEQQKVRVSVEAQGTYEELLKKYEDALGDPSTLPDVILTEDTTTQFMIDSQTIVPASSCLEADEDAAATYDDVLPAVSAAYTVDGVLWPAAFSVSTPVLYVNNGHFAAAGLSPDDYPQTLAEFREAAEAIKAANVPGVTEPIVMKIDSWFVEHWLTGIGEPVVNENNGRDALATESLLDQPKTVELLQWIRDMMDDGLLKAIPSTASGVDEYLAINNKTSSMLIQTSTAITTVSALLEGSVSAEELAEEGVSGTISQGLDIGVGPVPGFEEAGVGQIGGSGWYLVDQPEPASIAASWDFLKWFLQTPQQVTWTLQASYLPVLESAATDPTLQQEFAATTKGQWLSVAYQSLSNLDPDFPGPVIGPYKEFRAEVRQAMDDVALNGADAEEVVATADERIQAAIEQYRLDVQG